MRDPRTWKAWQDLRATLAEAGVARDPLDELEDHLCCELEARAIEDDREFDLALAQALEQLGAPRALAQEYRLAHPPMNPIPKLFGVVCALGVVLLTLGSAAELSALLQPSALLLVIGFVAGGLCACFGPRSVARAIAAGCGMSHAPSAGEAEIGRAIAARGARLAWAGGVIGFLAGLISLAVQLSDPAQVGPAIGLSLMSLLYGALLAELGFGSLRAWLDLHGSDRAGLPLQAGDRR